MAYMYVALFRDTPGGLIGLGTVSDELIVEAVRAFLLTEAEADVERFRPRSENVTPPLHLVCKAKQETDDVEEVGDG